MTDALKLTTYFGERDRAGERFLADALADLYARHACAPASSCAASRASASSTTCTPTGC